LRRARSDGGGGGGGGGGGLFEPPLSPEFEPDPQANNAASNAAVMTQATARGPFADTNGLRQRNPASTLCVLLYDGPHAVQCGFGLQPANTDRVAPCAT